MVQLLQHIHNQVHQRTLVKLMKTVILISMLSLIELFLKVTAIMVITDQQLHISCEVKIFHQFNPCLFFISIFN